jgi:hypothetical protein
MRLGEHLKNRTGKMEGITVDSRRSVPALVTGLRVKVAPYNGEEL